MMAVDGTRTPVRDRERTPAEMGGVLRSPLVRTVLASMAQGHHLTGAQSRILPGICAGLDNAEIAVAHRISRSTVNVHVRAILGKFAVQSRRDLIRQFVLALDDAALHASEDTNA